MKKLTRVEMKKVIGGIRQGGITCTITLDTTNHACQGLPTSWVCNNTSPDACQNGADNNCENGPTSNCCVTVDCPGAA